VRQEFYQSQAWRSIRYKALVTYGRKCMLCRSEDGQMHVDHIKPISTHPGLALEFSNLQILCSDCNLGKSNKDDSDFRGSGGVDPESLVQRIPPVESGWFRLGPSATWHRWNGSGAVCGAYRPERGSAPSSRKLVSSPYGKKCQACLSGVRPTPTHRKAPVADEDRSRSVPSKVIRRVQGSAQKLDRILTSMARD
jgi:hypothetical protein